MPPKKIVYGPKEGNTKMCCPNFNLKQILILINTLLIIFLKDKNN